MRTRSWEESIVGRVEDRDGGTIAVVVEPGDCTCYCVLLSHVGDAVAGAAGETTGWFVRLANFSASRAMYVRDGRVLRYEDVRDGLGVTAEGSAQLMCELIAHFTGSTRCETREAFEARLGRS